MMISGDRRTVRANSYDNNRESSSLQQSYNNESLNWNKDIIDSQYISNQYGDDNNEEHEIIDGNYYF